MAREQNLLSIGALSRACGIPADTLRTWERRYGFPAPERTESGHRRYAMATLERLQWVSRALSLGHRPSAVVPADSDTLRELLGERAEPMASAVRRPPRTDDPDVILERLIEHVGRFEGRAFDRELRRAWGVLGGMCFIQRCAGPLLTEVGSRWADGDLAVAHEHFCSERLRDFLVQQWRPLSDAATGPEVICATPSNERHVLGLQLAATTLALHDVRVIFLGADAPAEDIARAARDHAARTVVLSVSCALDPEAWQAFCADLRRLLPVDTRIVVGGRGVADLPASEGFLPLTTFDALADLFRS